MTKTTQPPTYLISGVSDFLSVPEDRRAVCLQEFGVWVAMMADVQKLFDGIEIALPEAFEWIDDGMHTMSVSVQSGDERIEIAQGIIKDFT